MQNQASPTPIALSGEFTIFSAHSVLDQLLAALADTDNLEVDLSRISEIDSAGVQLIVAAQKEAEAAQKTVRFVAPSPAVAEVLKLLSLPSASGAPSAIHAPTAHT